MCKFRIGQEVISISNFDDVKVLYPMIEYPNKGVHYHVRGYDTNHKVPTIFLEEISNGRLIQHWGFEPSFAEKQFYGIFEETINETLTDVIHRGLTEPVPIRKLEPEPTNKM